MSAARALLFCSLVGMLGARLEAHGGSYRGTGVAPPTPAGAGPASPGPGITFVPMAAASTLPSNPRDLDRWQVWWEFNKDPFLDLRARVRAHAVHRPGMEMQPSFVERELIPTLVATLRNTKQPDLASACLVALGKIGRDPEGRGVMDGMRAALRRGNQETRETAALAMGIAGMPEAESDLLHLVRDDGAGRRLYGRERVDLRTRVFAAYALGLLADRSPDLARSRRIVELLRTVLESCRDKEQELAVAAIHGIRLAAPLLEQRDLQAWELNQAGVDALARYCARRVGSGQQLAQAHASLALALALRGEAGGVLPKYSDLWLTDIAEPSGRSAYLTQSAAIALGVLGSSRPDGAAARLRHLAEHGDDRPARAFATLALGRVGDDEARTFLLRELRTGSKTMGRPWAALALGLSLHADRGSAARSQRTDAAAIGKALHQALLAAKNEDALGALAVALGLSGHIAAAPDLRALLTERSREDELAGYICIGLALLEDVAAVPQLRELAQRSLRRPALLRQIAVALGRLGDTEAGKHLVGLLQGRELNVATLAAVAGALGQIGDRSAAESLLVVLRDDHVPDLARAFAAAALGGIADPAPLPWHAALSVDANYRATLPTFSDGFAGVLDIL